LPLANISDEAIIELYTLRDMLRWVVSQFNMANLFYGHGTDNAWDEAVALVLHAVHLPPDISPQVIDARLTTNERRKIVRLVLRRIKERIPIAYLTHEAWFAGLPFYVDQRVLIPRSPIAELIQRHFSPWIAEENVTRILDLCTGSGCIAIVCALELSHAKVDAVDISQDALAVAKLNIEKHNVAEQVQLVQSDLFTALKGHKYDIIVSNPPYVSMDEMAQLPPEYRHEPALGLAAGTQGLDFVTRILKEAPNYLTDHGILIVEVGNSEVELVNRYPLVPFTWLEFQQGEGGVFMLTAEQLKQVASYFN